MPTCFHCPYASRRCPKTSRRHSVRSTSCTRSHWAGVNCSSRTASSHSRTCRERADMTQGRIEVLMGCYHALDPGSTLTFAAMQALSAEQVCRRQSQATKERIQHRKCRHHCIACVLTIWIRNPKRGVTGSTRSASTMHLQSCGNTTARLTSASQPSHKYAPMTLCDTPTQ